METLINFFNNNINYQLLFIIIFGGIFLTKYSKSFTKIKDTYKVLIASVLVSVIFYFLDDCKECLTNYFFTYLFSTSFYELIVKYILDKIKQITEK